MNEKDVAEQAYQNGYEQGRFDAIADLEKDGKMVLTRAEHQKYLAFKLIEPQIRGCLDRERELEKRLETISKETAEKFAERFEEYAMYSKHNGVAYYTIEVPELDEICKEITEGVK